MTRSVERRLPFLSRVETWTPALALCLAAAAAGCSSSSDSAPNGPRVIQVTRIWRQVMENGTSATYVPADVVGLSVAGASTTTTGGPSAWSVSGVPAGEYLLRIDWAGGAPWFVRTSADAVDLSVEQGGYGAQTPTSPTYATLDLTGLDPWDVATDSLQVVSWNGFVYNYYLPTSLLGGETALNETFDWFMALLSAGDRLDLAQVRYSPVPSSSDAYEHTVAVASVTGIAMTDGGTAGVTAALTPTTDNASLTVAWQASAFETGMQAVSAAYSDLYVFGAPAAAQEPTHYMSPDFLHVPVPVPAADRAISGLPYSAFVTGFSKHLYAGLVGYAYRLAPGATYDRPFFPQTVVHAPGTATALAPMVSPPRTVRIQGLDAMAPQTGVGVTPTITWSAPQIGSPSRYRVLLQRLYASGSFSRAESVATFFTRGTSVAVPSGLLAAGQAYLATVSAYAGPYDESTPLADGATFGVSSVVSETFSP